MKLTPIVQGEHKGIHFSMSQGNLVCFGMAWTKEEIRTLVEIANLLKHEGYELNEKSEHTQIENSDQSGPWGWIV